MKKEEHEAYMRLAINEARKNLKTLKGGPFGACIVKDGEVIAVAANSVLSSDATAHAEVNAIRKASKKLRTFDLSGAVCYATTEPCPMCFSALHWAKIKTIYYGTNIQDAANTGFNELGISNKRMASLSGIKVKLVAGVLRRECQRLFEEWDNLKNKTVY